MKWIFCCSCGYEEETTREKMEPYGHAIQCPACKLVCVKVYPIGGGREWVTMTKEQVEFHHLAGRDLTDEEN